jgi:tetratricopeptide (TPR) repeat protein
MNDRTLWQQADAVLDTLLDLPEDERAARITALQLAPDLHQCVRLLLQAHAREDGVLDTPVLDGAPARVSAINMIGRQFGSWVIDTEIGRGGMSVVYRAHHVGHPERHSALKLVTLGALIGVGSERFQREQSILARLNHPHIAPLFDAGVSIDGTPWLAMGLVEGERIDQWCNAHGLDIRSRVHLLLDVCDAVAYAHRNLVVHRDLKPSNVLVDRSGHVRLVDFGIARLVDEDADATATAARALSPQYAAPEQFHGALPATTMDVYGLGALLYTLLVGHPPRRHGESEATEPTAPSRAASMASTAVTGIVHQLRGDLDAIVLKALATDPLRRYATVEALAADARCWLEDKPVQARTLGRWGYGWRLLRQYKWTITAAAAIVLSLTLGLLSTLWQSARAEREAERAVRVRDFLADVFQASIPRDGTIPNALQILDAGTKMANTTLITSDPQAAADVLFITGATRNGLSDWTGAMSDLTQARRLLSGTGAQETAEFARIERAMSVAQSRLGRNEEALHHAQHAHEIASRVEMPTEDRLDMAIGLSLKEIQSHRFDEAQQRLRGVMEGMNAAGLTGGMLHADALNTMSLLLSMSGRPASEQVPIQEERLRALSHMREDDPGYFAFVLADLVPTFRRAEQYARAEALGLESVAISDRLYHEPHLMTAVATCNLGWLYLEISRVTEARSWLDRTISIDRAISRADVHAESCLEGRAQAAALLGDLDAASADLDAAERMLAQQGVSRSLAWTSLRALQATLASQRGNLELAETLLHQAEYDHLPEAASRPRALDLALAELSLLRGEHSVAEARLSDLREKFKPHALQRYWPRPWALSYLVALQSGNEAQAHAFAQDIGRGIALMAADNELKPLIERCLRLGAEEPMACRIAM